MHSFLYRVNALLTLATTVLAVMCTLASYSDRFHVPRPDISVKLAKIDWFSRREGGGNDEVVLSLDIDADLRSAFTWNTKQLFVFICAEYETTKNALNQISLWDRVIQDKEDAVIRMPMQRNVYKFVDQGNKLRGLPYNLTFYWNTMPITGGMSTNHKLTSGFVLPTTYSQ